MLRARYEGSSFFDYLRTDYPQVLPQVPTDGTGLAHLREQIAHATTVLTLKYADGVIVVGDRRATEGSSIAAHTIEKVHKADAYSLLAIAGAAGPCLEMARLFRVELEHYEKLEGMSLSLEGKANRLAHMIRANLPLALQGLVVIPLFVGYDLLRDEGKIFKYDVVGGRYEERDYYATGSGGKDARSSMKKLYRPGVTRAAAVRIGLEALFDAAEEDAATAGPDLIRQIYPTAKTATREGIADVPAEEVRTTYETIVAERRARA